MQLEELFQRTGNTLAVNELFFARMSDSSCAPVNSLLLPWETKPAPSEELKEVSQGSPVGAAPSGARATGAWPINHCSPKFIIPALSVYLGHAQRPGKGLGRPHCLSDPPPTPLNCPLVRFSHLWHHVCEIGLPCIYSVSLAETVFISLLLFSSTCQEITMYIPFSPFTSLRLAPAPNNPLSVLECLLGTLYSKHKSPGRILVEQMSRKPAAQAGDSSPMDKDTSLGVGDTRKERKGAILF